MHALSVWLGKTPLSIVLQNIDWVIPSVQTIHIVAVSIVIGSVLMLDLKAFGLVGRSLSLANYAARFGPWIWGAIGVLTLTGLTLVIAEPDRSVENAAFQLKMLLLLCLIAELSAITVPLRANSLFWEARGRRWLLVALVILSVVTVVSIVFAGRWIAYTQ